MDPIQKRELKRQAWRRLSAQRRRAGLLRGRVVVISLVCFAVLWGVVFAQMATGNDPVLAPKEAAAARARRAVKVTNSRELEAERRARRAKARAEEEAREAEPQVEEEAGAGAELVEPEPEVEGFVEAEPQVEEVETEPLVTSQS